MDFPRWATLASAALGVAPASREEAALRFCRDHGVAEEQVPAIGLKAILGGSWDLASQVISTYPNWSYKYKHPNSNPSY